MSVPHAYLFDAENNLVWNGHPSSQAFKELIYEINDKVPLIVDEEVAED